MSTRSIGEALAALVGPDRLREGKSDPGAAVDGCAPRWVVRPGTLEQVSGALALASDAGLAVVPRGSGSALELGRPPARVDLVLDMRGLDAVVEHSPDDLTVTVEAGVTAGALASRLAARRQLFPIDPPGVARRTLGGLVATNASGPLRARYGTVRDLLLGVRFVQAGGLVTWGGARVVKSVSGYDVPKLLAGSLGTLGVVGEVTLRLHPQPEAERTWLAPFGTVEGCRAFVAALADSTVQPNRVELLNARALAACGAPPAVMGLAVSVGTVEAAVLAQGESIAAFARGAGGDVAPEPDAFWATYDRAMSAGKGIRLKVATLPAELVTTARALDDALTAEGAEATIAGCCPLGVLEVGLPAGAAPVVERLLERLRASVGARGGSVVVQAGPRALRERVDPWGAVEPAGLDLMRALKREFDPGGVLNPGRFVGGI